uniref:Transmembrane protein 120A n=1 Tax=Gallus gallus TaxID=9031 RepID=A0A8V1AL89_CHICK
MASVAECLREWEELQDGFQRIQDNHRLYKQKLEELTKLQDGISSCITRQKKRLKELSLSLKKCKTHVSPEQRDSVQEIQSLIKERQNVFFEMEAYLPKKNGLYLSLVLGNVNVTLLSKQAKFAYKDEYEKFKLYLTIILLIVSFSCRFLLNSRVTDSAFNFLLVWYYCTLTIRESILINNGSKIKGWWVFHHHISTFLSGVMLTWPDGLMYQMFRNQFLSFSMYQSKCCRACWARTCLQHLGVLPSSAAENWLWMLTAHGLFSWLFSHPLPPRGQEELCAKAARSWAGAEPAGRYLLPSSPLSLQASCSSSSTTTRAGACTGSEHWARGTTWTSLWRASSPGCGEASPSCFPSSSLGSSGSSTTPSPYSGCCSTQSARSGRSSCAASPSSSSSWGTSSPPFVLCTRSFRTRAKTQSGTEEEQHGGQDCFSPLAPSRSHLLALMPSRLWCLTPFCASPDAGQSWGLACE